MLKNVLARIALLLPAMLGVTVITFFLSIAVPGDPVYALVGERASPELIKQYREKLGLDKNIILRYSSYVKMVFCGDLGKSYYTGRSIKDEIVQKFPNTLLLALTAVLFSILTGIILGGMCAFFSGSWLDKILLFFCSLLISFPVFGYGMILVFIFSCYLRWFPAGGMDHPLAFILPSLTLGSRSMAYLVRLTRSRLLEVLEAPFILAVRARGGTSFQIFRHSMMNVIVPIVTFIGLDFGSYLNGSVLTETIFGWDGIGRYAIQGILRRDYPVILGTVLVGALSFMLVNLIMDFVCIFLNPRLRKGGA